MLTRVSSMKMLKGNFLWSFLIVLLALPTVSLSQSYSGYNWYFGGSQYGIRFSRSDGSATLVTNQVTAFGTGGSAVASDAINGDLLFYTDGDNIFDRSHTIMPNGNSLGANTSGNQPVAIAKVPGQDNQYYVFTNTANGASQGAISYRIVDMSIAGNAAPNTPPAGAGTTAANTPVANHNSTSEAMLIIPHPNGTDFWLITHAGGSPNYQVTPFTSTGQGTTTSFNGLGLIDFAANFSYHPETGRIAVSPQEGTRDVEILNFDDATGALTFQQAVLNSGANSTTNAAVYDTEWSANGDYLYISRTGETGIPANVFQYDINNPSTTLASILPVPPAIANSWGLQMGPDSTIYHIYQATSGGPYLIGQISDTDSVANLVQYDEQVFGGTPPPDFNGTQFPAFAPRDTVDLTITFTSQGTCANAPTSFFPTVSPGADSLVWNFGDGSGSSDWSPVYTYEAGGPYNVSVIAYLNGQTDTTTVPINITEFDTQISLVQDTTGCSEDFPFPKDRTKTGCTSGCFSVTANVNGSGTPTLQWFGPSGLLAGETSNTLSPDSAGYYYLVATDGSNGCTTYAGVNIKEYLIQDQRANIWYFGNNAGLDFNPLPDDPVAAITNPVMNAPEGTATISDRNGQVIFFTDGDRVWNRQNQEIAAGIGGDPGSTQSALIMPVPGDETLYYIFTTQEIESGVYEIRYSLFDLKLNGGTGGVVEQNVLLFARSTERITGTGSWLIAHEAGNNSFRAYQVTSLGISNPVISSIGSTHNYSPAENGQGYMKLSGNGQLAVALSTPSVSNVVEIFDFADSTGVVSNFRTANLNQPNGQVYGVEFSPGGNKLFATLQSPGGVGPSQLVEFAIDSLGNPYLKKPPIDPVNETLGAIQMGPNGQLYVAVAGQPFVGTIQVVEDTTQVSTFTLNAQALAGASTSTKGLPNFIQTIIDPIQGPGLNVTGVCIGDSTQFTASGKDSAIDKFDWTFGDGQVVLDGGPQQTHLYAAAGTYTVNVRVYNNCESYNLPPQQVTINNVPADPTAVVVLCTGSAVLDANPSNAPGDFIYVWSTGDSTRTITVDRQAVYRVTVINAAGCSTDGNIRAVDNRPIVELGTDLTVCQNTPIAQLNAQNQGAEYEWQVNDIVNGNTSQRQSVNTTTPGLFEYKVTVTDPITNCFVTDSIQYTINASPIFTSSALPTTACLANDGSIDVNITGPANALFSYFITGPTAVPSGTNQSTGPIPTATGLAAGTYGITVADQVSGCATIDTEIINDNAFTITSVARQTTCDPLVLRVTHTAVGGTMTYRVINSATAQVVADGSATAGSFDVTPGVPSGSYIVELTANNCVFSSPAQNFTQDAPIDITFNSNDICNGNLTAVTNPAASSYNWTASQAGSLVTPGATTNTVAVNEGEWLIRVTADDGPGGACPGTDSTTVTVDNYVPAFTQSDACEDMVTLTATPGGAYTYRWFRNGTLVPGGRILTETSDNNSYFVQVVSAANGCVKASDPATVQVDGELTVSLATTTPCEGSPFRLTATPNRSSSFQWSLDGGVISNEIGPTLEDDRAGTYTVIAASATCTATTDIEIELAPATAGLLRDEAFICPDPANPNPDTRTVLLNPGDFVSYNWFRDAVPLGVNDPTYTATQPGIFSVALINGFGCPSTDKTEVIVECEPVIVGPNAFRPTSSVAGTGGDMVNQSFKLFTFFIDDEDFQIFIFNRWGEMIFQSPERDFKWNGGYNNNLGELSPAGTYSYVVRYKSTYRPEEGIQEKRGGVVLLR